MIQIDTSNGILIDGRNTGLKLTQRQSGTVIYTPESVISGRKYKEHPMPFNRYSAAHDAPHKPGVEYDPMVTAGRLQLERDVLALISTINVN